MRVAPVRAHDDAVSLFVVERYLAGWHPSEVRALVTAVADGCAALERHGVVHLRSVVIAGDETCLCLFEAPDADSVLRANQDLGAPLDRVVAGELLPT
jgi:Protein of unknown function (DUF4242)